MTARTAQSLQVLRSVLAALVGLGLLAFVGALVSYRADVAEAQRGVRTRVDQHDALYADSLALHLEILRTELLHLAEHPAVNRLEPVEEVLALVRDTGSLFPGGVVALRRDGSISWAEPKGLATALPLPLEGSWFQRLLASQGASIGAIGGEPARLVVTVPVIADGQRVGYLLGLVTPLDRIVFGQLGPGEDRVVVGAGGTVLLPNQPPAWVRTPGFAELVARLERQGVAEELELAGRPVFASATRVRGTDLDVVLVADEEVAIAPIRRRLIPQLVFLALFQVASLTVLTLFLRRVYGTVLAAEARLAEQEKMAALGTAASLIAHEVKNALNGLNAAASLLQSGGEAALVGKTIGGQVDRLGHLARSLLSFSRPAQAQKVRVELEALVRQTVDGLKVLPEAGEVTVAVTAPGPIFIEADPLLLFSAIDNLVRNAIEAAVGAKDLGRQSAPAVSVAVLREGGEVVVRVEDNAFGPPEGFEAHLGEPFFTTRSKGIGLGLAMARRAVEQEGGTLRFERIPGGSRFEVRLRGA